MSRSWVVAHMRAGLLTVTPYIPSEFKYGEVYFDLHFCRP